MNVHMGFTAIIIAMVLCARYQDSLLAVSVRRVHIVFSTAGFKGGEKQCSETRENAALRRGIQKASRTWPGHPMASVKLKKAKAMERTTFKINKSASGDFRHRPKITEKIN